jgi:hypothetical protein
MSMAPVIAQAQFMVRGLPATDLVEGREGHAQQTDLYRKGPIPI